MAFREPRAPLNTFEQPAPPGLRDSLVLDWKPRQRAMPKEIANAAAFRSRRERLSQCFPGDLLVVPAGDRKVRSNDTYYPFRPNSDFYYLTGAQEPDCVLVLAPDGTSHRHLLFVRPAAGKTDVSFFTDRKNGELWAGPILGPAESSAKYAIVCKPLTDLAPTVRATSVRGKVRVVRASSDALDSMLPQATTPQRQKDQQLSTVLAEMRLIKDAVEVVALREAIAATCRAFNDVVTRLTRARNERDLAIAFSARAWRDGNDVGYLPTVAAGSHACVLHWKRNDGPLRKRDLLLLDAGVESRAFYTADITRTLPISGRYSREQLAVYQIVLRAQRAALAAVKPGNDFLAPNRAALSVLTDGLVRLGILRTTVEESLRAENQFYRRYAPHNVSHMLGLDVHDSSNARAECYMHGKLAAGMVLTIEPGLYFQPDDMTVPRKYRGIGIRIEDDVLVTARGRRVLSARLPRDPREIEQWMRRIWTQARRGR